VATLALNVNNEKLSDFAMIDYDGATLSGISGFLKVIINSLACVVIDEPKSVEEPNALDGTPVFQIANEKSVNGGSTVLAGHPTSKISGTRTYTDTLFIFAVNNGKIDANALNFKATENRKHLLRAILAKVPQYPCDDEVTATLDYTTSWTLKA
jgi:hypothetical protein